MTRKGKIVEYREQLDKTLTSHDLTNEETLKSLVKDQILRSSEEQYREYINNVIHKRTAELSKILKMLRSASENSEETPQGTTHNSWKLKQDTEEFRVMYREGTLGSPFHTLLVEGYVDAPLDACLCISWETALYSTWFPEIRIPTFKIALAQCLQKIRIGEQISLVRVKLSWPLSDREALLHYFEFEYFKEGLIIVIQSTPDVKSIHMEMDGFSNDGIPEAGQTVRVDLVGGFALQKVSENRSYFRTIVNMDIKLDFVPPYLINFVSRQLIGGAFKLYKKTLTSVSKNDENFSKAMNNPIYSRIRKALYLDIEEHDCHNKNTVTTQHSINTWSGPEECRDIVNSGYVSESSPEYMPPTEWNASTEIEEEVEANQESRKMEVMEEENGRSVDHTRKSTDNSEANHAIENHHFNSMKKVVISPQVEQALETLDRAISVIRNKRVEGQNTAGQSGFHNGEQSKSDVAVESKDPIMENPEIYSNVRASPLGSPEAGRIIESSQVFSHNSSISKSRPAGSTSCSKEVNSNRIAPISPEPKFVSASESPQIVSHLVVNELSVGTPNSGKTTYDDAEVMMSAVANGITENGNVIEQKKTGQRKWRLCCLNLVPPRLVSS